MTTTPLGETSGASGATTRPAPPALPAPPTTPPRSALATHGVRPAEAASLVFATGGLGFVVGRDLRGEPVRALLFRAEPTTALLVGGLRFAQLMVFRAVGYGATVAVHTGRPAAWSGLLRVTDGPPGCLSVLRPGSPLPGPGAVERPQLVLLDGAPAGQRPPVAPWCTVLATREQLTEADAPLLDEADLALFQPLTPPEAAVACSALGLAGSEQQLTRLAPDVLTVASTAGLAWARLAQTSIEHQAIGPAARG